MELCSRPSGRLWHLKTKLTKTAPFIGHQTSHYRSVYNSSHVTSLGISAPVCLFRVLHNNDSLNFNIMMLTVCSRGCKEHKMNLVSSGYEERSLEANLKILKPVQKLLKSQMVLVQLKSFSDVTRALWRQQEGGYRSSADGFGSKRIWHKKICVWSQSQVFLKLRSL